MIHNYRPKEDWMQKGTRVRLSNSYGKLVTFTEANIENQQVVLSVTVQRDGVEHAFPFNSWDIEPITQ